MHGDVTTYTLRIYHVVKYFISQNCIQCKKYLEYMEEIYLIEICKFVPSCPAKNDQTIKIIGTESVAR